MFEWMNYHKKDIMKYTLYLVIPSFVLLYGYGECMAPQHYNWVAKVNDQEIKENTWRNISENLRNQYRNQPMQQQEPSYDELQKQALEYAIVGELINQKAYEWNIGTTDAEVARAIREIPAFQNESGQFDYNRYRSLLYSNQLTEQRFEEEQRDNLTRNKIQSIVRESLVRAQSEKQRMDKVEKSTAQVEFLAFEPASYIEEVTADAEGLAKYFEEHKEDFRVPEQRRVAYAKFYPAGYVNQVTDYSDRELTRYFDQNRQNYEVPEQITLQYITYSPKTFTAQVQASSDEVQQHYQQNQTKFMKQEQARVRFAQIPMTQAAGEQAVTDAEIEEYYKNNEQRFEHGEQAKASHILIRTQPNATPEQDQQSKDEITRIREEIAQGLPFADAAKQYSQDPGSGAQGGDLGYFDRGRMVAPFDDAVFSLPLGQISEPIKTQFGYHLIQVEDRKEAGKDTVEQARETIVTALQKQKAIQSYRQTAQSLQSLDELQGQYGIQTSDWIERNSNNIPGVPPNEAFVFNSAIFNDTSSKVIMAGNTATQNLYLIEVLEHQPQRPMTLEEAYAQVEEVVKEDKAKTVAQAAATADVAQIKDASVEISAIAQQRGLQVQDTDPFSQQDQFIPGFGPRSMTLNQVAFGLQQGQVGGPVDTPNGSVIFRLAAKQPARLPELADVRAKVEQDFVRYRAEREGKDLANDFSFEVMHDNQPFAELAASKNIEWGTTELFKAGEPIPGLGPLQTVSQQVFQMEKEGEVSDAIEERMQQQFGSPNQEQPVDAYYVVQLKEIKPDYLPELEEVRTDAEHAYRLNLAEEIAVAKANETLKLIQAKISSSDPVSATRTVDLNAFAAQSPDSAVKNGAAYRGPIEVNGRGQVSNIGRALTFTKTALALNPGQISSVVTNYRVQFDKDNERKQGPMTGAYILQVLDKKEPLPDQPSEMDQLSQYIEQNMQRMAVSAWIDEVSAASTIEYNQELLADEVIEDATVEGISASPDSAS